MGTTADKLLYLQGTKSAIKDAIVAKGVPVPTGTTFREYATKIGEITTGGGTGSEIADTWIRPTEWLALPDNIDGVQKVSILNAVFDTDSEFVALLCDGATYTVDWGDGTVENFVASNKAYHKYDYSNINLNSDTVAKFGYKQCIITITPLSGSLTVIGLNQYHTTIGTSVSYDLCTGFLDMRINALTCTDLQIGLSTSYVKHTMLEQCIIGELSGTSFVELFYDCYSLQSVSIKDTSNVTNFQGMHYTNYSLRKMPNYTFNSAGVNCREMFYNCYNLYETYPITITPLDDLSIINMFMGNRALTELDLTIDSDINYSLAGTFNNCRSIKEYKLTFLGSGKVTSLSSTFAANYSLIKTPIIDTSLCTDFTSTLSSCSALVELYGYDYSSATTLSGMLNGCASVKKAGHFNTTSALTNLSNFVTSCFSLMQAPTFDNTENVTTIAGMFNNCYNIKTVPAYNFPAVTTTGLASLFQSCSSLISVPNITFGSGVASNISLLTSCYSLKRMLTPLKFTFSVANAKMSAAALNEMYSILPTVTGQTVTVTGNYGVSGDDPSIAISKGWTVTG